MWGRCNRWCIVRKFQTLTWNSDVEAEMRANRLLSSAKQGHVKSSNRSAAKWWLSRSRVPMLNFIWTNHVCKRSLLFHYVSSENSLKYVFYTFFRQNLQTFDISHAFLPQTIAKLSTFKNGPFFWPPCTLSELKHRKILPGMKWEIIGINLRPAFLSFSRNCTVIVNCLVVIVCTNLCCMPYSVCQWELILQCD